MTEAELLMLAGQWLPRSSPVGRDMLAQASPAPGAYALLIYLAEPVPFARKGLGSASLAGWHVYAGSARGGGGIRARLQRHFRSGKPVHWHVDELTNAAARIAALAIPGGSECDIVARLLQSGRFTPALPGFGSSDCKICTAHLLRLVPPPGQD